MNSWSARFRRARLRLVALALLLVSTGVCKANSLDQISKDEYEVVSIALGKRTKRVFMDDQTSAAPFTLRDALSPPLTHSPQQADPALIRPIRNPTEYMRRWIRSEKAWREDEEAFKAEIAEETVNDWMRKNAKPYQWGNHFNFGVPTLLLTSKMNEELPQNPVEYWNQLRTKYPDLTAIEEASRVGFNQARSQAVVFVAFVTGHLGGEGQYILLERKNGRWVIAHRLRAWLS